MAESGENGEMEQKTDECIRIPVNPLDQPCFFVYDV